MDVLPFMDGLSGGQPSDEEMGAQGQGHQQVGTMELDSSDLSRQCRRQGG